MKKSLFIILLAVLLLCGCKDEEENQKDTVLTENTADAAALEETVSEEAMSEQETAAPEPDNNSSEEAPANDAVTPTPAPEGKHAQDPDALAALLDETESAGNSGDNENNALELMDYLGDIDSLIKIMQPEHAGTGMMSTENVDFCFGIEGVQDFYLLIANNGDENLRFLDIKIGDTEEEADKKLSALPYEAEGIGVEGPTYYMIWDSEAEYPFIALELFFDYDEPYVSRNESQSVEILRRTDPPTLQWWTLTNYFPSVAEQNEYYMSLSGNYAVYITDIQHYVAKRVQCAFTDLVYYGEVGVDGEAGMAFSCLDDAGHEQDFYYVYFDSDRAVAKVEKSYIY